MKRPLISFVVPMKEKDFRVVKLLESIRNQNYPQDKIEIIIIDGGSEKKVIEKAKEYGVKVFYNKKGLAEGYGMGKDQGIWKSKGKYVVIAESDIRLIGKDWINEMIRPLEKDDTYFGSVPLLYINKKDNITNRYLSYVGVDPFVVFRSLEGKLALRKLKSEDKKYWYEVEIPKNEPYCMGSNGFMFRRSLIKEVGDYGQDVEFIAKLVKHNYTKFAIPKDARVYHENVKGIFEFLKKRKNWIKNYSLFYASQKKNFVWITSKPKFIVYIFKNLLIFPNFWDGIRACFKNRDPVLLLHPFYMFVTTLIYLLYGIKSKTIWKQVIGK